MELEKIHRIRKSGYLSLVLRIIVGIIFLYTGMIKLQNPGEFAVSIQNYQIIPVALTNLIVIILPWIEIFSGCLLIFGVYSRASAIILSILTGIFIIAMFSAYLRGLNIECGCYGPGSTIDIYKILLDVLLLLFSIHLVIYPSRMISLDRLLKRLP